MVMKSPWLSPSISGEQVYASFTVIIGAMLFAAFIGNFTTAIASYDKSNAIYRDTIDTLRSFFKARPSLSQHTRKKVFRYADAYFKQTIEGVDERTVIESMPEHLRPVVLLELHSDLVRSCSWLQQASFACCTDFLLALKPEILLRGDVLLRAGVVSEHFYILQSGEMHVSFPPDGARVSKLSLILGESRMSIAKSSMMHKCSSRIPQGRIERIGSLIGWSAPHAEPRPHAYMVRASRDSELLSIQRNELAQILTKHELDAPIFKNAADHANKLINPIKRSTAARDSSGRPSTSSVDNQDAGDAPLKADRRCSTNEVTRKELSNGSAHAGSQFRKRGNTKSDGDVQDLGQQEQEGALREAERNGWLPSGESSAKRSSLVKEGVAFPYNQASVASLHEEVVALKDAVVALQSMVAKSMDESMALRSSFKRLASKPSLSW